MQAPTILHNAKICTVDGSRPWAQAVHFSGEKITAVGDNQSILALSSPGTTIVDVQGRTVLPGLCDAHIHLYDWSLSLAEAPLAGCSSLQDLKDRAANWLSANEAAEWVTGRGWNETVWPEERLPTRADLDSAVGADKPTLLWRSDMHCAVANSAALRLADIGRDTADPNGGRIGRFEDGSPNGLLWELAVNLVSKLIPDPDETALEQAIANGAAELNRLGITAVHDQRMKDQREGPRAFAAYQRLAQRNELGLRINCNIAAHDLPHLEALGLQSGFGSDWLRIGHMKLFADGTLGSQTAWMLTPFATLKGTPASDHGINLTPPEEMASYIDRALNLGIPTSVHAIGDKAIRVVLDIFEEFDQKRPVLTVPHRIEHVQIIDPVDLQRLGQLGLTASVQPTHVLDDMDMADRLLEERASQAYRFGSLAASGALLALGSDAPVADPNPFLGIHAAVCRQKPTRMDSGPWYPEERLSLNQAIYGYTLGPAIATGWQAEIGSIAPGKLADLIVLDRDIFQLVESGIRGKELAETKVVMTISHGQIHEF